MQRGKGTHFLQKHESVQRCYLCFIFCTEVLLHFAKVTCKGGFKMDDLALLYCTVALKNIEAQMDFEASGRF